MTTTFTRTTVEIGQTFTCGGFAIFYDAISETFVPPCLFLQYRGRSRGSQFVTDQEFILEERHTWRLVELKIE